MIQDNGLGSEMFVSVYEKLDKNGDKQLHCYRYTEDPIDLTEVNPHSRNMSSLLIPLFLFRSSMTEMLFKMTTFPNALLFTAFLLPAKTTGQNKHITQPLVKRQRELLFIRNSSLFF